MPPAPLTAELRALAPLLDERLGAIFAAIQALIAHHFLRHPIFQPVINPLWHRLNRARRCLARLTARIAAGKPLRASRAGHARKPTHRHPASTPAPRPPIPRAKAWLLKALGYHVAVYRYRLEYLYATPGMAELLAATPAAGRLLRPLCHMLGMDKPPGSPRRKPTRPSGPPPSRAVPPPPRWQPPATPCPTVTLCERHANPWPPSRWPARPAAKPA